MSILGTVRGLIQDTSSPYRFSDDELNIIMASAMNELNAWISTEWTISDLDTTPCPVPIRDQQVFVVVVKIMVVDSILANTDKATKLVTQDAQIDPSNTITRLNRMRMLLDQDLQRKLVYWYGLKHGAVVAHSGDTWGGA